MVRFVLRFAQRLFDSDGNLQNPDMLNTAATGLLNDPVWWAKALRLARFASA